MAACGPCLSVREYGRSMRLTLSSQDGLAEAVDIYTRPEMFDGREDTLSPAQRRNLDEFTFAEAITVHKAQGSQWNDVAIIDESRQFRGGRTSAPLHGDHSGCVAVLVVVPQAASSLGGYNDQSRRNHRRHALHFREYSAKYSLNEYFVAHPEMVLGQFRGTQSEVGRRADGYWWGC